MSASNPLPVDRLSDRFDFALAPMLNANATRLVVALDPAARRWLPAEERDLIDRPAAYRKTRRIFDNRFYGSAAITARCVTSASRAASPFVAIEPPSMLAVSTTAKPAINSNSKPTRPGISPKPAVSLNLLSAL